MRRWLSRSLISLLVVSLLAVASVSSAAAAERSLVPGAKLTDRPFRGITLVAVGNNVVCTGFVIAPPQGRHRGPLPHSRRGPRQLQAASRPARQHPPPARLQPRHWWLAVRHLQGLEGLGTQEVRATGSPRPPVRQPGPRLCGAHHRSWLPLPAQRCHAHVGHDAGRRQPARWPEDAHGRIPGRSSLPRHDRTEPVAHRGSAPSQRP